MSVKRPATAAQMRAEVAGLSSKAMELFAAPLADAIVRFCAEAKHLRVAPAEGVGWNRTGPPSDAAGGPPATGR